MAAGTRASRAARRAEAMSKASFMAWSSDGLIVAAGAARTARAVSDHILACKVPVRASASAMAALFSPAVKKSSRALM